MKVADIAYQLRQARMLTALACGLTILGGPELAASQEHHPMRFERVTLDDGLSQSNVLAIWQDATGYMWFGTENGLNEYNGYEFRHYKRERGNPRTLASDFVYDIGEDADGNLWVATSGGGLAKMAAGSRTITSFRHDPADEHSVAGNVIRSLLIDDEGMIWLGTRGEGLDRFDPATGEARHRRFESDDQARGNPNEIYALFQDARGSLWIGSNGGLIRLDVESGATERFTHDANDESTLSDNRVRSILEDSRGRLWVGTYGGGLNRLEPDSGSFERFRHDPNDDTSIAGDRVTSIFEDGQRRLWIGTSGGLNLLDRRTDGFVRFAHDPLDPTSLGDDSVTTIFQDRGGVLWVGTRNRGLSKWNPRSWLYGLDHVRELAADGQSQPNVTSFVEDGRGRLWIGTFGDGLSAIDRESGEMRHFRNDPSDPDSLSDDRVMSLMRDRRGSIWAGTMTAGIDRLDPGTGVVERFRHDPDDPRTIGADGIMALFEDSKGLIWVGTFGGGISRFDPRTREFRRFPAKPGTAEGPSSNRITSFAEGPSGMIWIGTDAGGLNLFDPATERFHQFRHDPDDPATLASDTVYAVNVDAAGRVWVGTRGGLDRVVGDVARPGLIRFANVSQVDGLANDVVYGVRLDGSGRLWLSTNYGISRFDPATGAIENLHRSDGMQSEEFNFGAHYRSDGGELFFGGHNGINAFHPEELEANDAAPAVVLTAFAGASGSSVAAEGVDLGEGIEIAQGGETLSFELAALDYAAPERNRYMYKLEGLDRDWKDLGNRRRLTFTGLDDGSYVLRVKAANSDGVWNNAGVSLPVRVLPPFWETWWAYLAYLAVAAQLATALWLAHRRKVRREEQYSRRLELEVQERTQRLLESNEKLKQANQALQESSLSDPLTGLRNRRFVFEQVSRDLDVIERRLCGDMQGRDAREGIELVFMMIDLDNFKPINDTYGHAAGDRMLLEVRDVLLETCRASDFVIRWGGDEFVIIAKQAHPDESRALAQRICTTIAGHHFKVGDGLIVRTTCSIGFAVLPLSRSRNDGASLDEIINLADGLMYEAKRKRNTWAGMMSPSDTAIRRAPDFSAIDPSSVAFGAQDGEEPEDCELEVTDTVELRAIG